ncbi:MAG: hypothetical protein COW65_19130 [Cytophagales bacterium CG18_big_fil_WC_8_21_14_2_50_42_9]|nr:MAG: hypothetical protein COW65_19130 [Cytophagales bacterium CG18_big_fil_WC_8_21_14_2_50_42_9]
MKKISAPVSSIVMLLLLSVFTSCGEPEDIVIPQNTCDTMATVHYESGSDIQLILEDGRVLTPANISAITNEKGETNLEISGFAVKEGQQIIVGYEPANQAKNSKKTDINCIVGVGAKIPF